MIALLHRALDRWDEGRARRGDATKEATSLVLGAKLAFPGSSGIKSITDFCALADRAAADPGYFAEPDGRLTSVRWDGRWIKFRSSLRTGVEANDLVVVKVTERLPSDRVLVVFHHWNAETRYAHLARILAWHGITVAEMALPYHLERRRPRLVACRLHAQREPGTHAPVHAAGRPLMDGNLCGSFATGDIEKYQSSA